MKHVKFTLLTLFLIPFSLLCMIFAAATGIVAEVSKVARFESAYHLFHYMTVSIIDMSLQTFDVADAILGNYTLDYFKVGFGSVKQEFSVNYYDSHHKNLHSTVCDAHCKICAVHEGYHNKAAGYEHVEVEALS